LAPEQSKLVVNPAVRPGKRGIGMHGRPRKSAPTGRRMQCGCARIESTATGILSRHANAPSR